VKPAPGGTSSPIKNASWKPFTRSNQQESATDDPAEESPDTAVVSAPPAKAAPTEPHNTTTPHPVVVNASKPQPVQVRDAFLQACKDQDPHLRGQDLFHSAQSVVVYDQLQVKKVHISGNAGWAEVQIDEPISVSEKQVRKHTEHQRWALARNGFTTWELTPARNTIYLTQSTAARLLADQLAQLTATDSADTAQQKAELARLLDALLEHKP
jgi:hypothetical protein